MGIFVSPLSDGAGNHRHARRPLALCVLMLLSSCAGYRGPDQLLPRVTTYQVAADTSRGSRFAPLFRVEEAQFTYNRPGAPQVYRAGEDEIAALVDPEQPTLYFQETDFQGLFGTYHNLIYRLHFQEIPAGHLGSGSNVGLVVVVTLDSQERPLLYTLVHTCGCYLAFVPTSCLPERAFPRGWNRETQEVYGEVLPGLLSFTGHGVAPVLQLTLRSETHRVMDVRLAPDGAATGVSLALQPMSALQQLPLGEAVASFFEGPGGEKGYVRGSHKLWERLLISWWALDWRVGADKDLGPAEHTGVVFYTSLKPWARQASDLWEFRDFLTYWGWTL